MQVKRLILMRSIEAKQMKTLIQNITQKKYTLAEEELKEKLAEICRSKLFEMKKMVAAKMAEASHDGDHDADSGGAAPNAKKDDEEHHFIKFANREGTFKASGRAPEDSNKKEVTFVDRDGKESKTTYSGPEDIERITAGEKPGQYGYTKRITPQDSDAAENRRASAMTTDRPITSKDSDAAENRRATGLSTKTSGSETTPAKSYAKNNSFDLNNLKSTKPEDSNAAKRPSPDLSRLVKGKVRDNMLRKNLEKDSEPVDSENPNQKRYTTPIYPVNPKTGRSERPTEPKRWNRTSQSNFNRMTNSDE
jgi:hypothetical protein